MRCVAARAGIAVAGLSLTSSWWCAELRRPLPTDPQGGADIVMSMHQSGDLAKLLKATPTKQ